MEILLKVGATRDLRFDSSDIQKKEKEKRRRNEKEKASRDLLLRGLLHLHSSSRDDDHCGSWSRIPIFFICQVVQDCDDHQNHIPISSFSSSFHRFPSFLLLFTHSPNERGRTTAEEHPLLCNLWRISTLIQRLLNSFFLFLFLSSLFSFCLF